MPLAGRLRHPAPWQVALVITALALAWQWLIVRGYFEGHWSALFMAGDEVIQSPAASAESIYLLRHSTGYDGEIYHTMAHDPLDLHGTDRYVGSPHIRYPRILLPALSYALGALLGVDRAYRTLELLFLFLGVLCTGAWGAARGKSAWWGAVFALVPGAFISLERQLVDLPLCGLLAAAFLCLDRGRYKLCWLMLACAGLTREMGLVAIAGFALAALLEKRIGRAAMWLSSAAPSILWTASVFLRMPPGLPTPPPTAPILPILKAAVHFRAYPFAPASTLILDAMDVLALAGLCIGIVVGLIVFGLRHGIKGELACTGLCLALFGIAASGSGIVDYTDAYSFGRQASPLLLVQLFQAIDAGTVTLLLPLAMMLPRCLVPGASMTWRAALNLLRG